MLESLYDMLMQPYIMHHISLRNNRSTLLKVLLAQTQLSTFLVLTYWLFILITLVGIYQIKLIMRIGIVVPMIIFL